MPAPASQQRQQFLKFMSTWSPGPTLMQEETMPHPLTLTIPIKQDEETQTKLARIAAEFPTNHQPKIDAALRKSKLVHFARVVNVHNKFLQVITEFDGDHKAYTEFFRKELPDVFDDLFSLADAPNFNSLDQDGFFKLSKKLNIQPLGTSTRGEEDDNGNPEGYLFSAYDSRTVKEIQPKL
jgi:hypothetical protein